MTNSECPMSNVEDQESVLLSFNFLLFMRVFSYDPLQCCYFQELMKYFYERNV